MWYFDTHLGRFAVTGDEQTGYYIKYPNGFKMFLPRGYRIEDFIKAMSAKLR